MVEPAASTSPPARVDPPAPSAATATPLYETPLFLACCILLTIFLQIYNNGYVCFRIDQTSQIPLLYMKQDPTLFLKDWFLNGYGHFDLRKYHLLLMTWFARPLGLPLGILTLYFLALAATLGAWYKISKKVYGSSLPALLAGVMATFLYGQEIGSNHPFEKELIPRTEAYPFAWFGLYCALCGRPFFAGLLMAIAGVFQPAVGLLFAVPVLVWLLACLRGPRLKSAGLFQAGFVLPFSYRVFSLREAIQDNDILSAGEEILLAAYIRHPHHMVPHLWGSRWLIFAAFFALFVLAWRFARRARAAPDPLAQLAWVITALLAVATFFIEVLPQRLIILIQPFRMAVTLYVLMMLVSAPYLLELLRRPAPSARMRALLLLLSPYSRWFFTLMVLLELSLFLWERRRGPLREGAAWIAIALAIGLAAVLRNNNQGIRDDMLLIHRTVPPLALALIGVGWLAARYRILEKTRELRAVLVALVLLGFAAIGVFFLIPARWFDVLPPRKGTSMAALSWEYQFNPQPLKAIERLGAWAERNTPKDALFLVPPEPRMEGFQIWSKRAAVFCFKYIPLKTSGLKAWKERYLALRGISDPGSPAEKAAVDEAMSDYGGFDMDRVYHKLSAAQVLGIARKYGADHIITQVRYDETDPAHFKLLTQDINYHMWIKEQNPYFLFKIIGSPE